MIQETVIKFHGTQVKNVVITCIRRSSDRSMLEKLDVSAAMHKRDQAVETINIQTVAEYVTITYYKDEGTNLIINRELIPAHSIEHILVVDA
jgi:hypothetical protein